MEKVTWFPLSANINAIHLLEQNLDKIDWYQLSSNINTIDFMEIDWSLLSENINAIPFLEKHLDKIRWYDLCTNINAKPSNKEPSNKEPSNKEPSNKGPPNEVSYTAYIRFDHFKEILSQFHAKETTQIPPHVIKAIKGRIIKERITDTTKLNYMKRLFILLKNLILLKCSRIQRKKVEAEQCCSIS